jgi:hypothetical protein
MGKTKLGPGTWVERDLFESKAYLSLKGFAPQLLILFLAKRQFQKHGRKGKEKRICVNHDSILFTFIEAKEKYGITKSRFSRAIDELLAKGFITIVHHGGGFKQDKSIYALSDKWMLWQPGTVFETRKKVKVQRGFCQPKTKVTLENVPIHSHENVPIREALG